MLPEIPTIRFKINIPILEKEIEYRPFNISEYKLLLQAKELGDDWSFANAIVQVVNQCLFEKINIEDYPIFVIDYIFLMIRAKSIGEIVNANYVCNSIIQKEITDNDGNKKALSERCGTSFPATINLVDSYIEIPKNYEKNSIIKISEDIGLKLKSPTFSKFKSISLQNKDMIDITDEYLFSCIEMVFDKERTYTPITDFSIDELTNFFEKMTTNKIDEISNFLNNQPSVCYDLSLICPKCKTESKIQLRGIDDFFA